MRGVRFELVAVIAQAEGPYSYAVELLKELGAPPQGSFALRPSWGAPPRVAIEPAPRGCKWPEVAQAFAGWDQRGDGECLAQVWARRPHLIWRRVEPGR